MKRQVLWVVLITALLMAACGPTQSATTEPEATTEPTEAVTAEPTEAPDEATEAPTEAAGEATAEPTEVVTEGQMGDWDSPTPTDLPETVTIGVAFALSGPAAVYGESQRNAVEMAL